MTRKPLWLSGIPGRAWDNVGSKRGPESLAGNRPSDRLHITRYHEEHARL